MNAVYAWTCELSGWIVVFRVFCELEAERASVADCPRFGDPQLRKTEPAMVICSEDLAISLAINPAPSSVDSVTQTIDCTLLRESIFICH